MFRPAVGGDWRAASMASSNCASSCGDEAATRPPGPRREGSAHHCQVSEPNQTSDTGIAAGQIGLGVADRGHEAIRELRLAGNALPGP